MQYPIIDLISNAYLNNGWTGLDISTGKNLLNPDPSAFIETPGYPSRYLYQPNIIPSNAQANMSFTDNDISVDISGIFFGFVESFLSDGIPYTFRWIISNGTVQNIKDNSSTANPGVYCTSVFIYPNDQSTINKLFQRYNIQVELGANPTPYEPYNPNVSNDFPNRLKLPLPHYFPHPVIDALKRAAAGTQTADDTEILRHYLTPLGIGGI